MIWRTDSLMHSLGDKLQTTTGYFWVEVYPGQRRTMLKLDRELAYLDTSNGWYEEETRCLNDLGITRWSGPIPLPEEPSGE